MCIQLRHIHIILFNPHYNPVSIINLALCKKSESQKGQVASVPDTARHPVASRWPTFWSPSPSLFLRSPSKGHSTLIEEKE